MLSHYALRKRRQAGTATPEELDQLRILETAARSKSRKARQAENAPTTPQPAPAEPVQPLVETRPDTPEEIAEHERRIVEERAFNIVETARALGMTVQQFLGTAAQNPDPAQALALCKAITKPSEEQRDHRAAIYPDEFRAQQLAPDRRLMYYDRNLTPDQRRAFLAEELAKLPEKGQVKPKTAAQLDPLWAEHTREQFGIL